MHLLHDGTQAERGVQFPLNCICRSAMTIKLRSTWGKRWALEQPWQRRSRLGNYDISLIQGVLPKPDERNRKRMRANLGESHWITHKVANLRWQDVEQHLLTSCLCWFITISQQMIFFIAIGISEWYEIWKCFIIWIFLKIYIKGSYFHFTVYYAYWKMNWT